MNDNQTPYVSFQGLLKNPDDETQTINLTFRASCDSHSERFMQRVLLNPHMWANIADQCSQVITQSKVGINQYIARDSNRLEKVASQPLSGGKPN